MPRITTSGSESSGGWQPLPAGTYDIQIDKAEEAVSKNGNKQIKVSGQVVGGAHASKKVTIFYVLTTKSYWKLKNFILAADVEHNEYETDDVTEDGKPIFEMDFELDDLPGNVVRYDVIEDQWEGKPTNRFNEERSPSGQAKVASEKGKPAAGNGNGRRAAAAPEPEPAPAPVPDAPRRRRVAP